MTIAYILFALSMLSAAAAVLTVSYLRGKRRKGLPTTWRGRKILTLEECSKMDFPFPPEPDLADD